MTDEQLKKAKNKFKNCGYDLEILKKDIEWNEMNVPYKTIISWVTDYIDDNLSEIDDLINNANENDDRNGTIHRLVLIVCIVLREIDNYKLCNYFPRIVSLLEKINYDECLLYSQDYSFENHGFYIIQYLLRDKENIKFEYEYDGRYNILYGKYEFDTGKRFIGLLPILYESNQMNLFYKLFDIICDLIINYGRNPIIRDLYNYAIYIDNKELIGKVVDAIRKYKNNYYLYRDLNEIEEIQKIHISEEKELNWLRRNFCLLLTEDKDRAYSNPIINYYLDYYKLDKKILFNWEISILDYYEDILNNAKEYIVLDTNFVKNHSKYYIEYLNKTLNSKCIVSKILIYCISNKTNEVKKIESINNGIQALLDFSYSDIALYVRKEFFSGILSDDLTDGYLLKYHSTNIKIYNLYKSLIINIFNYSLENNYLHKNGTIDFAKIINLFAIKYKDNDLLDISNDVIKTEIESNKDSSKIYILKEIEKANFILNEISNIQDIEKRNNICNYLNIFFSNAIAIISRYRFNELLDDVIILLKKANYDEVLLYNKSTSSNENNINAYCYLDYFINNKKNVVYDSSIYYDLNSYNKSVLFSMDDDNYFGLIPYLYKSSKIDLFNDLIDIFCDLISNYGFECLKIITNLYNYAIYIDDKELIGKVVDAIRKYKNNYYLYRDLNEIEEIQKIRISEEKELNWLRRNFCLLLTEDKDRAYSNPIINYYLDYYKLDKKILFKWETSILDYYEDILNNAKEYIVLDTNFVKNHSKYYIEYLKSHSKNDRLIWKIFNNYLSMNYKIDVINNFIKFFIDEIDINNSFNSSEFNLYINSEFLYRIIDEDLGGLLKEYFNIKNDLYEIYKKFSLALIKLFVTKEQYKYSYEDMGNIIKFSSRLYTFFNGIKDNESYDMIKELLKKIESKKIN